ncbi:hypothetical protein DL767_006253 [Monosporascus sp. MG133]|nr:hypothetical protein DL767_006253 [Monosporascus sp. MG133]
MTAPTLQPPGVPLLENIIDIDPSNTWESLKTLAENSSGGPIIEIRYEVGDDASPVLLGGGKYAVARGQATIVVLAGVNRDPAVFADPLVFDPGRMTGEAFERLQQAARRYFGNGKCECGGRHWEPGSSASPSLELLLKGGRLREGGPCLRTPSAMGGSTCGLWTSMRKSV